MLNSGDHLILANVIPLLHQELGDAALRIRAYVDVIPRFNLTRSRYDRSQVRLRRQSRLDRHQVFLAPFHAGRDAAGY
jgi:hypothetical protein